MGWSHLTWSVITYASIQIAVQLDPPWGEWSACSKPCGIGKRNREQYEYGIVKKAEEHFCNLNYCPSDYIPCADNSICNSSIPDGKGRCVNGRCMCTLGLGYNKYNCMPEFGNCTMRKNPVTAMGYKDPSLTYKYNYPVYSCTTNDNPIYEVHVIAIYGELPQYFHKIIIVPTGPINKPIVLVLSSYWFTYWDIFSKVQLHKILFGGNSRYSNSKVYWGSECERPKIVEESYLYSTTYGRDTDDGDTIQLLKDITRVYGPITSFTGVKSLRTSEYSDTHILLEVGGDPLSVRERMSSVNYKHTVAVCKRVTPPPNYTLQTVTLSAVEDTSGLSGGAVAGIVIGSIAGVTILIVGCLCCMSYTGKGSYNTYNCDTFGMDNRRSNQIRRRAVPRTAHAEPTPPRILIPRNPYVISNNLSNGPERPVPSVRINHPLDTELPPPYEMLDPSSGFTGEEPPPPYESVVKSNNHPGIT